MPRQAVVIGLDGAAWQLLEPLLNAGAMPRLASLCSSGATGTLSSTVPTYTPPAWTSAITGVNPGRHGVYGFHAGSPQSERLDLMHSGRIKSPALWRIANQQGARVGIYNVPLTYPPQEVDGWMISGMMTPSYAHRRAGFAFPKELEDSILSWVPDYAIDLALDWDKDWRDTSLCERAVEGLRQRHDVLERLLETEPVDVVFTVLETPDRLQHVYYRYLDPRDDFYTSATAKSFRPAIVEVFRTLDRIVGLLDDYAGDDGGALVCSDHGFTAWESSLHTNRLLEKWGYLRLKPGAKLMRTELVRRAVPLAKRVLGGRLAREAKKRTFAAIDWSQTKAFATYIPQQGIHLNVRGRERLGIVDSSEIEPLKDEIAARFETLRTPGGDRVTDRVWRSEEVFEGTALEGAPDLMPVLRDYRIELDDEIFHKDLFTDYGHLPRGAHHPDGIVALKGRGIGAGARITGSVVDVTPTILYMAGLKIPEGLDGKVLTDAFDPAHLANSPPETAEPVGASSPGRDDSPYSAEEEEAIERSLRGLGYL
jgi:predicted AlkP superfamily phosphohydrolase/phosphomutase